MFTVHLRDFFIIKICNFITKRFYFGFQIIFIIEKLAIKFFFDISLDFITKSSSAVECARRRLGNTSTCSEGASASCSWCCLCYTDFITNSIIFFLECIIFNQRIHPFSLSIITFYITTCLKKHYMQWFTSIIIIQVTNKVFVVFFIKGNLVKY